MSYVVWAILFVIGACVALARLYVPHWLRRSALLLTASPVVLLLLMPGRIYLSGLCLLEGGIRVAQPVAGIEGWVLDPQTNAGCKGLCRSLLTQYSFVEVEVPPDPRVHWIHEPHSQLYRFALQKKGWRNPRSCIDTPDRDGWCVTRQEIQAFSTPYMFTTASTGSRFLRVSGET